MRRLYPASLVLAAFLAACDSLGLGTTDIEGTWLLSARNLNSPNIHCQISGLELHLQQDGDRFWGTTSGGQLGCRYLKNDSLDLKEFGVDPVVAGRLIGDSVTFQIGSADWLNAGRIEGRSMTGTMNVLAGPIFGGTAYTGSFGAVRTDTSAIP